MSFHEILNRANDNVLEITTQMIDPPQNATLVEKSLTFDDFADFLFDHLKVNPDDCSSYTFSQYSNNSKELKFKPTVDISPYLVLFLSAATLSRQEDRVIEQSGSHSERSLTTSVMKNCSTLFSATVLQLIL